MTVSTTASGVVVSFDPEVGLGAIRRDDGVEVRFHCVEIADGSRRITVGTAVRFTMLPKLGVVEAASVTPV